MPSSRKPVLGKRRRVVVDLTSDPIDPESPTVDLTSDSVEPTSITDHEPLTNNSGDDEDQEIEPAQLQDAYTQEARYKAWLAKADEFSWVPPSKLVTTFEQWSRITTMIEAHVTAYQPEDLGRKVILPKLGHKEQSFMQAFEKHNALHFLSDILLQTCSSLVEFPDDCYIKGGGTFTGYRPIELRWKCEIDGCDSDHDLHIAIGKLLIVGAGFYKTMDHIASFFFVRSQECSHLCGIHTCANVFHLAPESAIDNLKRQKCHDSTCKHSTKKCKLSQQGRLEGHNSFLFWAINMKDLCANLSKFKLHPEPAILRDDMVRTENARLSGNDILRRRRDKS